MLFGVYGDPSVLLRRGLASNLKLEADRDLTSQSQEL